MTTNTPYAIECLGITKTFGSVIANDHINLNLQYGEILALLGENGSGKTTLMNMLSGIYHPDNGTIRINGSTVTINSPSDSIQYGIGMIHQHFKLVDIFTAFDNIIMGNHNQKINIRDSKEKLQNIITTFGFNIDINKKIYNMSVSEKQTVEILKVIYRGSKILILDEPTAVLTPQETNTLFEVLQRMRENGCAVIIITHKLNEVMAISNRVSILRKGKSVATVDTDSTDIQSLTNLMVGGSVNLSINRPEVKNSDTLLNVYNLTVKSNDGSLALDDISFNMNSGEILGVAGIAGSGQKELCDVISGLIPAHQGTILYKNENLLGKSPREIINMGISMSFVPEDRLGMGLVASMGMTENMMLKSYNNTKGPFINKKPARELSHRLVKDLDIKTPNIETPVRMLSGGNVQKVLLGREIEAEPNLLITAYPVRGLDINSSYMIYDLLNKQKENGVAVLFIGEDLDVLLEISDRLMVLCHGKISGIVDAKKVNKEQIGLMMAGQNIVEVFENE